MSAHTVLADRYRRLLWAQHVDPFVTQREMCHDHLIWMCEKIIENSWDWPYDKTGRWIGFIQGILAAQGLLNIQAERDFTRPMFHEEYERRGVRPPQTLNRRNDDGKMKKT